MLQLIIEKLKAIEISDIYINIHHYGDQIIDFLKQNKDFGCNIHISDERDLLLNTGGGLKKVLSLIPKNEDLLIHNVDILSDVDLNAFVRFHQRNKSIASLLVKKEKPADIFYLIRKWNLKPGKTSKPMR